MSQHLHNRPTPNRDGLREGNAAGAERVLVTGAAGFIGSHVVEALLRGRHRVVGVDNFDPFYPREEKERNLAAARRSSSFRLVVADCANLNALETALGEEPFDVIVHLAAKAGVRPSLADPLAYINANVVGTQSMLEFARRRGIERFVLASSSSVYGNCRRVPFQEDDRVDDPISPYAATKVASEVLSRTYHHLYGIGVIALRFFTVYGPRQRPDLAIRKFATKILRGEPIPIFGDGTTQRDYTWIDDILQGVLAAIQRTRAVPGTMDVINLGGNRTHTLSRLVELLGESLGVEPRCEMHPLQPGDVTRTYADISRAHELLGYQPRVMLDEGIPLFVEWLRETRAGAGRMVV
jgi:UDP-glucuronate 4-epimerase